MVAQRETEGCGLGEMGEELIVKTRRKKRGKKEQMIRTEHIKVSDTGQSWLRGRSGF